MSVDAQNLVQQLLTKAIHHGHHDDQRGDAEHDAEEREPGIDRDETLLSPRPQVAPRKHPFEWREGAGAGRLTHRSVPRVSISHDSGRFEPFAKAASACQPFGGIGLGYQLAAAVRPLLDLDLVLGEAL